MTHHNSVFRTFNFPTEINYTHFLNAEGLKIWVEVVETGPHLSWLRTLGKSPVSASQCWDCKKTPHPAQSTLRYHVLFWSWRDDSVAQSTCAPPEDTGSVPALRRWLQLQRVPYLLGPPWGPVHTQTVLFMSLCSITDVSTQH